MRVSFRLGKTLKELLDTMTLDEAELWMAFERLEGPLGPERDDLQSVQTSATVANMFRSRNTEPINPVDLIPDWAGNKRERQMERTIAAWQALGKRLEAEQHG